MTEKDRKIGISHGMVHDLVDIKRAIGRQKYARDTIPRHHVRRRRPYELKIEALTEIYDLLEPKLRRLQASIAES